MRFCLLLFFFVLAATASRLLSICDKSSWRSPSLLIDSVFLIDVARGGRGWGTTAAFPSSSRSSSSSSSSSFDYDGKDGGDRCSSSSFDPDAPLLLPHQLGRDAAAADDDGKAASSIASTSPNAIDARRQERVVLRRSTITTPESSSLPVRRPGRYRDIFTLHVKLQRPLPRDDETKMPSLNGISNDNGDTDTDGGEVDNSATTTMVSTEEAAATAHGELVIVTDTVVTASATEGGPSHVELLHQEVTSRAAATTVTQEEEEPDEPSSWIEICHATTSTRAQFTTKAAWRPGILRRGAFAATTIGTGTGINQFLRRRRLLSLPSPPDEDPFQDGDNNEDPRCASLLAAMTGGADKFHESPPIDDQGPSREGLIPIFHYGTNRYLDVIPFHAVRPGDSWPVTLSTAVPSHLGGAGSSLTGVATFLGYQSSSACGRSNVEHSGPRIAVIQVRGTTIEGNGIASVAANDDEVVTKLYFDVSHQLVRYVTVDQRFVLRIKTRDGDGTGNGTPDRTLTTIPVRGTVVMETLWEP